MRERNTHERETSMTSNLSPSRKEGGKRVNRETGLTSNVSLCRKERGRHV
jgi:hypothetical protein